MTRRFFSVAIIAAAIAGFTGFSCTGPQSRMYPWEKNRESLATTTDAVLCYGGSHHRNPFLWDKERFAPYVTYVDQEGKEQWLFDGFIFLESQDVDRPDSAAYTYMTGVLRDTGVAAGKEQWQELIDYYFAEGNCIDGLEEAVKAAESRLGKAPQKRRVIMVIPDPVIYHHYIDTTTTTTYWGSLDGRQLDFRKNEDRIDACKWFIDQVRAKFAEGNYEHVDLAGFYWLREAVTQPQDTAYSYFLTRSDIMLPHIAEYLHGLNYTFNWIPFYDARGFADWRKFDFDQVYMQPNHYWKPEINMDTVCTMINRAGTSMEFEFEASILKAWPGSDVYRARFRDYMKYARQYGIYGKRPLAYYQGSNALYNLSVSNDETDKEFFHEFCRFVIGNPLRSQQSGNGNK
ncbi:DUF4855 domain-containing protein [Alistipes sp.]|uniref:DUF4855 domain-containing protein n=1 Tax=Alistipes sp. TaxID=1872444 RepID=UPI003AB3E13B